MLPDRDYEGIFLNDGSCYLWFALDDTNDLYPECLSDLSHAPNPNEHWLHNELGYDGWNSIMDVGDWLDWALENGIAPGQPFLVWVARPRYYECYSEYGTEYDVEFESQIVQVVPWTPEEVLYNWERWSEYEAPEIDIASLIPMQEWTRVG